MRHLAVGMEARLAERVTRMFAIALLATACSPSTSTNGTGSDKLDADSGSGSDGSVAGDAVSQGIHPSVKLPNNGVTTILPPSGKGTWSVSWHPEQSLARIDVAQDGVLLASILEASSTHQGPSEDMVVVARLEVDAKSNLGVAAQKVVALGPLPRRLCTRPFLRLHTGQYGLCVIERWLEKEQHSVFFPLSDVRSASFQEAAPLNTGALDPAGTALTKDGVSLVLALDQASWGAVWLSTVGTEAGSTPQTLVRLDTPFAVTASGTNSTRAWLAGSADPTSGPACAWWTGRLDADTKLAKVQCQTGPRRHVASMATLDDQSALAGWGRNEAEPSEPTLRLFVSKLSPDQQLLWDANLGTSWLGSGLPALIEGAPGLALSGAWSDVAHSDTRGGSSRIAALRTWRIGEPAIVAPAIVLPEFEGPVQVAVDRKITRPTAAALNDKQYLLAWTSEAGIHWRTTDAWGAASENPACNEGSPNSCQATKGPCDLRTCLADGCAATIAADGMSCGGDKTCQAGSCK